MSNKIFPMNLQKTWIITHIMEWALSTMGNLEKVWSTHSMKRIYLLKSFQLSKILFEKQKPIRATI